MRLDAEDHEENPDLLKSRMLDDGQEGECFRRNLIQQIDDKLKEYGMPSISKDLLYIGPATHSNSR